MRRNKNWPRGIKSIVTTVAIAAVERSRGFDFMTPRKRMEAALHMDELDGRPAPPKWAMDRVLKNNEDFFINTDEVKHDAAQ